MSQKSLVRFAYILLFGLIVFGFVFAFAANNIVPVTRLTDQARLVTANDLKPPACSALFLTAILYCPTDGGQCSGTDASELVIGSIADDAIDSGRGDDCILSGGGNDSLKGEKGLDVCVGGPGTDAFHPSCETQLQ